MDELRQQCAANLQRLARWATETESHAIPVPVMRKAAEILADDLSAIIGARDEPEVAAFQHRIQTRPDVAEATVWCGRDVRADRLTAAVANAIAADWLELDEGYRPTPCHGGLYVLPALLAQAESSRLTCEELLRSLVLAYELVTRVARTWKQPSLNMQAHGRYAAIGAAAGVGLAMRLHADAFAGAIGAAATLIGPAPRSHLERGILIRNAWPASGAWNGMMAIEWGACGITGTPAALQDVYGTVLGGEAHPEELARELGSRWAVLESYTKIYACCQHLHSAVEAALTLRDAHPEIARPEAIKSVDVRCHPLAMGLTAAFPTTSLGAKFSMPHAVAAALLLGDAGARAFSARSIQDPGIGALRQRVTIQPWAQRLDPPNDRPAGITVHLHDGQELAAECLSAEGGPDRSFPATVWIHKMRELAEPAYPGITPLFQAIVEGDKRRLRQSWSEIAWELREAAIRSATPGQPTSQ